MPHHTVWTTAVASNVATDLRDRVKDTATAVSQKASDYAAALSDHAGQISERATGYVASLSDQASDLGRRRSASGRGASLSNPPASNRSDMVQSNAVGTKKGG